MQSATAFIGGTPKETNAEATRLTVLAAWLETGEALGAEENPVAKFDIVSKIPPDAAVANVAVTGKAGKPCSAATAHISLTSAISAQSMAQGQPWSTFSAGDPKPAGHFGEKEYLRGGEGRSFYRFVFYENPPLPSQLCLETEEPPDGV